MKISVKFRSPARSITAANRRRAFLAIAAPVLFLAASLEGGFEGKKVAVVVHPLEETEPFYERYIQTRVEEILQDNAVTLLDKEKAEELKTGWPELESQGGLITAERLMELEEEYEIEHVVNVFFKVDVWEGLGEYYTAAGQVNARVIGSGADVVSGASSPMGVVGNPASDGVSAGAAASNAMGRALDEVMRAIGFEVMIPSEPRSLNLRLVGPVQAPGVSFTDLPKGNEEGIAQWAELYSDTWRRERVTATASTTGGDVAAAAGYAWQQSVGSRRVYGARIHLLDLQGNRTLNVLDASPLEVNKRHERASKEILHCAFIDGWRYLAAVNGNEIFLWDVERGRLLGSEVHEVRASEATLRIGRTDRVAYLSVLLNGNTEQIYRIEIDS